MKRIALCVVFCLWGLVPGFARKQLDTVRAALIAVIDSEKLIFTLEDGDGKLKVRLGGKPKVIAPDFYALDVRNGDTLTVAGVRKAKKRSEKNISEMVSAVVLGIDYAFDHDEKPGYYFSLDQKPSFQGGGTKAFSKWVTENLVYPDTPRKLGSEGTTRVKFTIEKDGSLSNIYIVESSGDPLLDIEALRIVSSSPAWTPGAFRGVPVRVSYTIPVVFILRRAKESGITTNPFKETQRRR